MVQALNPADYTVANGSGSAVRDRIEKLFATVLSTNSASSEPSYKVAGSLWWDTTGNGLLKVRNNGSDWRPIVYGDGGIVASNGTSQVLLSPTGSIEIKGLGGIQPFIDFASSNIDYDIRLAKDSSHNMVFERYLTPTTNRDNLTIGEPGWLKVGSVASGGIAGIQVGNANEGVICAGAYNCRTGYQWDTGNATGVSSSSYISGAVDNTVDPPSTATGKGYAKSTNTPNTFNVWYDGTAGAEREYVYIDNSRRGYIDYGTSDYRIKREIADLDINGIERVKKLRTVSYKRANYDLYKASEHVREGFIAHEVGEVIPDAVKTPKDDANLQQIESLPLIATLTKALQEAVAKIETLETKVAALEAK